MPTGTYPGRNTPVITITKCKGCGEIFEYKYYEKQGKRRFCTSPCHMTFERERRRKVPHDYNLLYDLYWNQNQTTTEIGKHFDTDHCTVKRRMIQLGIPRRKPGLSRWTVCKIEGCEQLIYRIKHRTNGSYYGRRCFLHWVEHRHKLTVDYWQKVGSQKPEVIQRKEQKEERREIIKWTQLISKLRIALKEQNFLAIKSLQQEFEQARISQT